MATAAARRRFRFNFRGSLCMPFVLFMILFVIIPLGLIFYYAFTNAEGQFSLHNWGDIFTSPEKWKVIGVTFIVAALTTVCCILVAYPIAFILSNSKLNKNKVLVYMFLLPMWVNFVVRTMGLKDLLNGVSEQLLGWFKAIRQTLSTSGMYISNSSLSHRPNPVCLSVPSA